ncbi:MAG: transposase [Acidimicrobiales bacterium]
MTSRCRHDRRVSRWPRYKLRGRSCPQANHVRGPSLDHRVRGGDWPGIEEISGFEPRRCPPPCHARQRGGNANSGRGAAGFLTETFNRVRAAGATGPLTLRADSGFYSGKVAGACRKAGVRYSITVKLNKALHKVIAAIPDDAWVPIPYFLDGGADVAETTYRPFGGPWPQPTASRVSSPISRHDRPATAVSRT